MDMRPHWIARLRRWASLNGSIGELWLFGSRAKGKSRERSDVDLAIVILPGAPGHDWPMGNYFSLGKRWQRELETIVRRHVSLEPLRGHDADLRVVRTTGVRLWPAGQRRHRRRTNRRRWA